MGGTPEEITDLLAFVDFLAACVNCYLLHSCGSVLHGGGTMPCVLHTTALTVPTYGADTNTGSMTHEHENACWK